ncbi:energy transducer TonB [Iodobacter fluviatilis]|uniref:TonB C-terminal domain-containing protein n=1 Tax=Iodobacter fluviatilis TaxID=537 RepID=A0A377Q2B3_9NEIS|nr:hypothetical protein [Iodobacter fluviatilis]TCU90056.1 hypothetical protein EV682_10175 [Iodobacter fluviatilis]STQ89083.1 Uncharacterised protein [Iodobacter fluviatilis]
MIRSLLLLCFVLGASVHAHAGLADNEISAESVTGSNIAKKQRWNGLPLNKSYAELSEQEKLSIHALYQDIKAGDEPPYPLKGMRAIIDPVNKITKKILVTGNLELLLTVNANGEGENVEIISSPDPKFTQLVISILFITQFKPAICNGQPCAMQFPLSLSFERRFN